MFKSKQHRSPRPFDASRNGTGNARPSYPRDTLIEIVGFSLNNADTGTIIGRTINREGVVTENEVEIHIVDTKVNDYKARKQADKESSASKEEGTWQGVLINEAMAKAVPEGSWVVAESARWEKKVKVNGADRNIYAANWIRQAEPTPDKTLQGILTADTANKGHVHRIQHWDRPALSVTHQEAAVVALGAEYDEVAANWNKEDYLPYKGYALRAVARTGKTKEVWNAEQKKKVATEVAMVLDCTYPVDWDYIPAGAEGNEAGAEPIDRPITGESMLNTIDAYIDYIKERFPDQEVDIEVLPYKSYYTSRSDNSFNVRSAATPLGRMSGTPMRLAQNVEGQPPEELFIGKNYAVNGILLLRGDTTAVDPKTRKTVLVTNYMAKALYPNAGFPGPLHNQVRTHDGLITEVHPDLDMERAPANSQGSSAPRAQDQQVAASTSADGGFGDLVDVGESPFETSTGTDAYADAFDSVASDTFEAPVAETPAAPVQAPPAGGLRRRLGSSS